MTTSKYTFFLRFYYQTDSEVEKCVAEIKTWCPLITGHYMGSCESGMNVFKRPSHNVILEFDTKGAQDIFLSSRECRKVYQRYANPKPGIIMEDME